MITTAHSTRSTLRELTAFMQVIKKESGRSLFSAPAGRAEVLAMHLEQQLPKEQAPAIFRRLGKHTQLVLHF